MVLNEGPIAEDVVIRREVSLTGLSLLDPEIAASEDGIMLNHSYFDTRGYSVADALEMLAEEEDLLAELASEGWRSDAAGEIVQSFMESGSDLMAFDPGVGAAVIALSAAGATPISSCNGGLAGADYDHAENLPTILFAGGSDFKAQLVEQAIINADLGLVHNDGFAEIFSDKLLKFHDFARKVLTGLGD